MSETTFFFGLGYALIILAALWCVCIILGHVGRFYRNLPRIKIKYFLRKVIIGKKEAEESLKILKVSYLETLNKLKEKKGKSEGDYKESCVILIRELKDALNSDMKNEISYLISRQYEDIVKKGVLLNNPRLYFLIEFTSGMSSSYTMYLLRISTRSYSGQVFEVADVEIDSSDNGVLDTAYHGPFRYRDVLEKSIPEMPKYLKIRKIPSSSLNSQEMEKHLSAL